jgi:hypothetical protein
MKNITNNDLWNLTADIDEIQDLLLDMINDNITVEQVRELILKSKTNTKEAV